MESDTLEAEISRLTCLIQEEDQKMKRYKVH